MGIKSYYDDLLIKKQINLNSIKMLNNAIEDFKNDVKKYTKERNELKTELQNLSTKNEQLRHRFETVCNTISEINNSSLITKVRRYNELNQLQNEENTINKTLIANNKKMKEHQQRFSVLDHFLNNTVESEFKIADEKLKELEADIAAIDQEIIKEAAKTIASDLLKHFGFLNHTTERNNIYFSDLENAQVRIIYEDDIPKHQLRLLQPRF